MQSTLDSEILVFAMAEAYKFGRTERFTKATGKTTWPRVIPLCLNLGHGRIIHGDGEMYIGEWKYNQAHGNGFYLYSNGSKY